MTSRHARFIAVAIAITSHGAPTWAQQQEIEGANAVLPWGLCAQRPNCKRTRKRPIRTRW